MHLPVNTSDYAKFSSIPESTVRRFHENVIIQFSLYDRNEY